MTVYDVQQRIEKMREAWQRWVAGLGTGTGVEVDDTGEEPEPLDTLYEDALKAIAYGQCQTDPPEDVALEALKARAVYTNLE